MTRRAEALRCCGSDRRAASKPWMAAANLDSSGEAPSASRTHAPAAAPPLSGWWQGCQPAPVGEVFSGCNCIAARTIALRTKTSPPWLVLCTAWQG